jgi:hypothetical protein
MDLKLEALIAQMKEARQRLNSILDKLESQTEIYPAWKLKQVLDHITGWDELVIATLQAYQKGENPARLVRSINQYNDASVNARQSLTMDQSRQAYDKARAQVLQTLQDLPAELLNQEFKAPWGGNCSIINMVKIFVVHEQEHANQIEKIVS